MGFVFPILWEIIHKINFLSNQSTGSWLRDWTYFFERLKTGPPKPVGVDVNFFQKNNAIYYIIISLYGAFLIH
jgi:hypothetical protein